MNTKRLILRDARREDVPAVVRMLVDDPLGSTRERYAEPLPQAYYDAFDATAGDPNNRHLLPKSAAGSSGRCISYLSAAWPAWARRARRSKRCGWPPVSAAKALAER